jgi:hypothetical protein
MKISRSVLLSIRNVSDKICRKNIQKLCIENRAFYGIISKLSGGARVAKDDNMGHGCCVLDK